jgi:hypothetical protein
MLETHLLVDRPVNINACTVQYVLVQDSYKTHTRLVQDPLWIFDAPGQSLG